MKPVGADDYFEVRQLSLVSDVDRLSLSDLYLPLIGAHGFALYFSLLLEANIKGLRPHENLFLKLGLTPGQFEQAMSALEAVGLVRTYHQEDKGIHVFVYCLFAPLTPEEFFDDVLFSGTLKRTIGEKEANALMKKYLLPQEPEGYEEISMGFVSYFHPDYDDPVYRQKNPDHIGGHLSGRIKTSFDPRKFYAPFLSLGYSENCLSEAELKKVERLSALYVLDSETLGSMAVECFYAHRKVGFRLDFKALEAKCRESLSFPYLHQQEKSEPSQVSSDTVGAKLIKYMDQVSPVEFLTYLQNGHKPGDSDLKLIRHLAIDLGLPNSVINALIWVTLQRNGNSLPYAYADKVGSALLRVGCKTARDAMDYLSTKKGGKKTSSLETKPVDEPKEKENEEKKAEEEDEEDLDTLLQELYASEKGK